MAKKKIVDTPAVGIAYERPPLSDNNPSSELCPKPDHGLEGCRNPRQKKFADLYAAGESPNRPDVYVQTANGVSSSFGKNKGRQYNWGNGDAGVWNDTDFEGGNLTGL